MMVGQEYGRRKRGRRDEEREYRRIKREGRGTDRVHEVAHGVEVLDLTALAEGTSWATH